MNIFHYNADIEFAKGHVSFSVGTHVVGASAALASALCWAVAAVLFRQAGRSIRPLALNFGKGIVAAVCLSLLLIVEPWQPADYSSWLWLGVSGLLGIVLGDTLYFHTLQRLGARYTLLLGTLIPVVVAFMSRVSFNEQLPILSILGLGLTIVGVTAVLWQASAKQSSPEHWLTGVLIGACFVFSEAGGILLSKLGVVELPAIQATLMRQAVALAALTFWGLAATQLIPWTRSVLAPGVSTLFFLAAFIGAFLGTYLSILALKLTYTAVAAALNSTSPLFVLPLAAWWLKEKMHLSSIAGTTVAVAGIIVYFLSIPAE